MSLNGPPVTLDGVNGIINRIQAINRYITKNLPDHEASPMESFDLSECYSKLDQDDIKRILARMIAIAFIGKRFLAVIPSEKSGRWIEDEEESTPFEIIYTATDLREDVFFLISNAYIE